MLNVDSKICENCNNSHNGKYGSGRFCCKKCTRSFATKLKRQEINKKVSNALRIHQELFCKSCGKKIDYRVKSKMCKSCYTKTLSRQTNYQYVKTHRVKKKIEAVKYKGGKCIVCGYSKCLRSLDFHHLNKKEKEFCISRNLNRKWELVKKELDKCVLLCKNCHGELHDGLIKI